MRSALRIPLQLAALLAGLLLTTAAHAHVVKQIFAKFTAGSDKWQADVTMDAGYAWPAYRDDPNSPQPTLEWLESRPPKDFVILRRESEDLLRQHLEFRSGETPLTWTCRFPDFDSFPPDFPEITGGGAFLTVRIEGPLPPPGTPLTVQELTRQLPDFVFQTGEDQFPTLEPGKSLTLFETPGPAKKPEFLPSLWQSFLHVPSTGWDCALSILAIVLPDRRLRSLLLQFVCYAVGSSITFWLAGWGVVHFSPAVLRSLAALGVAVVAANNLWNSQRGSERLIVVLGLSFVHGLTFGEAFTSTAPPGNPLSLLASHLGFECAAAAVLFASGLFFYLLRDSFRDRTARELNFVLLLTGLVLCLQRALS